MTASQRGNVQRRNYLKRGKRPNRFGKVAKLWWGTRQTVLLRDDNKCVLCGDYGNEVDHIEKRSTHPELRFVLSNLRTLCGNCHRKRHEAESHNLCPRKPKEESNATD
jgi:5-methylcytosine-specific restriction protein A